MQGTIMITRLIPILTEEAIFEYSLRRLSQWIGVADESDVSYAQAGATISGSSIDDKYAYGYDKAHLENAYEINIRQQPDQVKEMIEQNGAVGAMYYDTMKVPTFSN